MLSRESWYRLSSPSRKMTNAPIVEGGYGGLANARCEGSAGSDGRKVQPGGVEPKSTPLPRKKGTFHCAGPVTLHGGTTSVIESITLVDPGATGRGVAI